MAFVSDWIQDISTVAFEDPLTSRPRTRSTASMQKVKSIHTVTEMGDADGGKEKASAYEEGCEGDNKVMQQADLTASAAAQPQCLQDYTNQMKAGQQSSVSYAEKCDNGNGKRGSDNESLKSEWTPDAVTVDWISPFVLVGRRNKNPEEGTVAFKKKERKKQLLEEKKRRMGL